jgi:hypothetical protein
MDHERPDIQARLAALADGTLAPEERERLLEQIDRSAELREEAECQRHAVSIMDSLQSIKAPAELHRSVAALSADAAHRLRPRRALRPQRLRLAGAGALAAIAFAALLIALTAGSSGGPTLLRAADVALRPATLPAPAQSASRRGQLTRSVDGIAYPYWQDSLGWRAAGARVDRLGSRTITTVFYKLQSAQPAASGRIGYAIVAGSALPIPAGGSQVEEKGIAFHVLTSRGTTIVTWRRTGHTCILVAREVSSATLIHLASWQ